jgi:hypothetical protein
MVKFQKWTTDLFGISLYLFAITQKHTQPKYKIALCFNQFYLIFNYVILSFNCICKHQLHLNNLELQSCHCSFHKYNSPPTNQI